MLNQSNDSADKTADQSVIELDEADSSITMLLHWKNHHHQNPTLPCTLEFSNLRVSDVKDNSMVSDTNFSDVCNVEEFDKNRERPAEKILDQLNETGNPAELSLDDPDLERLLDDIYSGHIAKPHWWHLGSWLYAFLGSSPRSRWTLGTPLTCPLRVTPMTSTSRMNRKFWKGSISLYFKCALFS